MAPKEISVFKIRSMFESYICQFRAYLTNMQYVEGDAYSFLIFPKKLFVVEMFSSTISFKSNHGYHMFIFCPSSHIVLLLCFQDALALFNSQ